MSLSTKIFVSLALFAAFAHSAVNFPYPQEADYGHGTINATSANASANLKSKFTDFLTRFYETGNCKNNVPCARIKWDNSSQTVSEGIGYGMLMMVYFSETGTNYQDHFDRLWAYYQNWPNNNKLMNWKINGFTGVAEYNAATDAEFDVAIALAMAHYQFGTGGNKNYLDSAKALIAKIRQYEISTNNLHKPGDAWESERNPSYVSPAAFEIYKEVESDQAAKWQSVIDANYTLLTANQNSSSGLFSDWCRDNGSHSRGKYGYDAARTPWRVAWGNAWYGHASAKTLLTNLYSKFLSSKSASSINGDIELNGTMGGCCNNSTFVGPFTNAFSYSSANQTKMNEFWTQLMSFSNESYYNAGLQVLTGLLASGNMPNLKALSENANNPSSSSEEAPTPSSSSSDNTQSSSSSSSNRSSSSDAVNPIAIYKIANGPIRIHAISNAIVLENLPNNASVQIYNLRGNIVGAYGIRPNANALTIPVQAKGLYIAKVNKEVLYVPVK